MTAITPHIFDVFEYVKKCKELGVPEQVAEYQARQLEQTMEKSIEVAVSTIRAEVENKEVATKSDISLLHQELQNNTTLIRGEIRETELRLQKEIEMVRKEIAQTNNKTITWVIGLLLANGLFQYFLHFLH